MSPVRRIVLAALLTSLGALFPSAANAATPAPAWSIFSVGSPAHFTQVEPTFYTVRVVNVGAAPSDGSPITITDVLPSQLTLQPFGYGFEGEFAAYNFRNGVALPPETCEPGPPASCTITETVVRPGEAIWMIVPVETEAGATGTALNEVSVSGGGAAAAAASELTTFSEEKSPFAIQSLYSEITGPDGSPQSQAGSHPYNLQLGFQLETNQNPVEFVNTPGGAIRNVHSELPQGMVVNPNATTVRCTETQFQATECPAASAVGLARLSIGYSNYNSVGNTTPLYNMVPPPGTAAELAFEALGLSFPVHLLGGVDSAGNYALNADARELLQYGNSSGATVELWGDPSAPSHDGVRGICATFNADLGTGDLVTCPGPPSDTAFLTMPTACSPEPLASSFEIDSWQGEHLSATVQTKDTEGNPVGGVDGCNALEFEPAISSQPTTNLADSPTGLDFVLHQPQNEDIEGLSTAALKDVKVTLPAGMSVNPSGANGLAACSTSEIGYAPQGGEIHFSAEPQSCPDASKIGRLEVKTPLLEEKLGGAIYTAKPFDNPFGTLLGIYLAIEDEKTGIVAKLAGKVEADPNTGRLTATFKENPQLPIEDIETRFFGGAKAVLKTPLACGTYSTETTMVPWSTPEGADAHPSDAFATSVSPSGAGGCPASEGQAPNEPSFSAGTVDPKAGAYSPFVLKLARQDGTQQLTGLQATLPEGLLGKLAGIPYCSEAQIAQAQGRSQPNQGALEQQSPSCPAASELGTVSVGAGAGPTPFYATGHAYLAGPYKGAPLSMAIVTPAVAGPFDLGAVVVRAALNIDPVTTQIHAVSDPFPSILHGIPLDLRSVALKLDRPEFTLNPTSCDPSQLSATLATLPGQSASLASPFQVGGCQALKYKPSLTLRLKGGTQRADHPKLIATFRAKPGEANTASAQVKLPPSAFLDQAHIRTVCTRVQFAANACPRGSIYGSVSAKTPLLDQTLSGNVYLRSSNHKLPDLVAALRGPESLPVAFDLSGRTDSVKGALRNTFEAVPDVPVSNFRLELFGGKRGLIVNSRNLCVYPYRATVKLDAQSGKTRDTFPLVRNDCRRRGTKGKSRGHGHGGGR